jgi:CheY-like chemotaxis protein
MQTTHMTSALGSIPTVPTGTALIVEDDDTASRGFGESLKRAGMHVVSAHSHEEATAYIEGHLVDLALIDLHLNSTEGFRGLSLVTAIRQRNPRVSIALQTSDVSQPFSLLQEAFQAGADVVVSKADAATDVNRVLHALQRKLVSYDSAFAPLDAVEWLGSSTESALTSDVTFSGLVDYTGQPVSPLSPPPPIVVESILAVNAELLERAGRDQQLLNLISPRQFELLVAEILSKLGYDVTPTPATRDGGFDLLAVKKDAVGEFLCLVECKRYVPPHKVGVSLVRSLNGVLEKTRASAAMLVTTSSFTKDAEEFQHSLAHRLMLRDYLALKDWLSKLRAGDKPRG